MLIEKVLFHAAKLRKERGATNFKAHFIEVILKNK
jgi:hypothetical protein